MLAAPVGMTGSLGSRETRLTVAHLWRCGIKTPRDGPGPLISQGLKRDSSLAKGARRWGGGPPSATRRTKTVREKKPGRYARNDIWGAGGDVGAEAPTPKGSGESFLQGLKPNSNRVVTWGLKPPPPKEN